MWQEPGAILQPTVLEWVTIAGRLALASLLGGVIGFERERRHRAAGLRTHMLVALAAAAFSLLMLEMMARPGLAEDRVRVDPTRIIEAVTAGVAFLAAGAIIQTRGQVRGLTTGAGLWLAGALGTASGLGYGFIAVVTSAIGLIIISVLRWLEPAIAPKRD